jgi:hypothetical protein
MKKLEIKTKENGNLEATFTSKINIDNGRSTRTLGIRRCIIELFIGEDKIPVGAEVVVYDDDEDEYVEQIGLWFEKRELVDYDGVFELPKELIKMIRFAKCRVPRHFEEDILIFDKK